LTLPAAEGFFEIIKSPRNFVRKILALLAQNDVLMVGSCKIRASAEALPQEHRGHMDS
jgi:hypothetical protein